MFTYVAKHGTTWLKCGKTWTGIFYLGHFKICWLLSTTWYNVLQPGNNMVGKDMTEGEQNVCITLCYVSATLWYVTIRCGTLRYIVVCYDMFWYVTIRYDTLW